MGKKQELIDRIRKQVEWEVSGDVEKLYGLIDPKIRTKRELERIDEPNLTKSAIQAFIDQVTSAEVIELHLPKWELARDGTSAAVAEIAVRYNSRSEPSRFRTVWYQRDGIWFTTALSKMVFPKNQT